MKLKLNLEELDLNFEDERIGAAVVLAGMVTVGVITFKICQNKKEIAMISAVGSIAGSVVNVIGNGLLLK
ncbi:MAG: hypothetical protein ACRCYT_02760 [Cetobacterium sp.]